MIRIKFGKDHEATFSGQRWKCIDKDVQKMLNSFLDWDEASVSDAYRTSEYDSLVYGLDGVALDAISFLEPEIVEYVSDEIPEEEKGIVV